MEELYFPNLINDIFRSKELDKCQEEKQNTINKNKPLRHFIFKYSKTMIKDLLKAISRVKDFINDKGRRKMIPEDCVALYNKTAVKQ